MTGKGRAGAAWAEAGARTEPNRAVQGRASLGFAWLRLVSLGFAYIVTGGTRLVLVVGLNHLGSKDGDATHNHRP